MIDGLKLTFSGEELRKLLEERIADHDRGADRWRRELSRIKEDEIEDAPPLPAHMCEHEQERHLWRAEVLAFIRDHIESQETYRIGASDGEFGELFPAKPASVEWEGYEQRTGLACRLEPLTKRVGELGTGRHSRAGQQHYEPPGYKVTRVDVENGAEIIHIDQ